MRWNQFIEAWVSGSDDANVRIWSSTGVPLRSFRTTGGVTAMCIDKNYGFVVVATSGDHIIRVYDTKHDMVRNT